MLNCLLIFMKVLFFISKVSSEKAITLENKTNVKMSSSFYESISIVFSTFGHINTSSAQMLKTGADNVSFTLRVS